MSLHPTEVGPVPEETARVAHAAFPSGNVYVRMRDTLRGLYDDAAFAPLFAVRGRPPVRRRSSDCSRPTRDARRVRQQYRFVG